MCVKVTPMLDLFFFFAVCSFRHFAAEWSSKQGQRFKMGSPEAKIAILVFQVPLPHESKFSNRQFFPNWGDVYADFPFLVFAVPRELRKLAYAFHLR